MLTSAFFILKDNEELRNFAFNLDKYVLIIWLFNMTNQFDFDRFQNTSSKKPHKVHIGGGGVKFKNADVLFRGVLKC